MKIVWGVCGKNLGGFESIVIDLNRVDGELSKEKGVDLGEGGKISDVCGKGDKKVM